MSLAVTNPGRPWRYYSVQLIDDNTYVYGMIGSRATGSELGTSLSSGRAGPASDTENSAGRGSSYFEGHFGCRADNKRATKMQTTISEHYKPPVRFGLGGVPLGNEFAVVTEKAAYATLEAAWSAGVRYYDTSPWYGLGLCERRFGNFLHTKDRSEYVLSSKVGKLLKASRQNNAKEYFAFTPSPNNLVFDYTADGVMRSVEDSLQRLGVDALDIVFVHDLSPDNRYLPSP